MKEHPPLHADELTDLERRLTEWRPESEGLDAEAMRCSAGIAVGRRGRNRLVGLVLCGCLAASTIGLGAWGLTERAERQMLASRLIELGRVPTTSPLIDGLEVPKPYTPLPSDYFSLWRTIEQDPNRWLASAEPIGPQAVWPPPPARPILTPRQRDGLLDQ